MNKQDKRPRNQRADGLKCIRIELERGADGQRRQKSFYAHTLKECEAKKAAFLKARDDAIRNGPVNPFADYTVAQWADRWLTVYGSDAGYSATKQREINCKKLIAALGAIRMEDVKPIQVQQFANGCARYSRTTVNKIRQHTLAVFQSAVDNGAIQSTPCKGITWKSKPDQTHRYLDQWEIQLITQHWQLHRVGLWCMVMLWAGLRRGELMGLRWSDIDMEGQTITVGRAAHFEASRAVVSLTKTETSKRVIPLLPPLLWAFTGLYGPPQSEYVCCTADGRLMTETGWRRAWQSHAYHMGIVGNKAWKIRPHDLRHSFASILYDAGVDVLTAQKWLGHASPEITMKIYTHLSSLKEQSSLDLISAFCTRYTHFTLQSPQKPDKSMEQASKDLID